MSNFSTVTHHDRGPPAASPPTDSPQNSVSRDLPSDPPKSTSPKFSNNVVDSRTFAKPPSTPLYRIPKPSKALNVTRDVPLQQSGVAGQLNDVAEQSDNLTQRQNGASKPAVTSQNVIADEGTETDGSQNTEPTSTMPSVEDSRYCNSYFIFHSLFRERFLIVIVTHCYISVSF